MQHVTLKNNSMSLMNTEMQNGYRKSITRKQTTLCLTWDFSQIKPWQTKDYYCW